MTIAVIIPVLNEERVIEDTLRHICRLGFDEIVVVDGGSIDRTADIVRRLSAGPGLLPSPATASHAPPLASLPRFVSSDRGRARQMNAGALASRSETLLFLHADTRLPENARRAVENALADAGNVGGRFDVLFDRRTAIGTVISFMMNLRSRWSGIATGDQALFVRRSIFEKLGGYPDIPLMEDVEFTKRLNRLGTVVALRDRVVTSYRRWETRGPVRTILLMWSLRLLYWAGVNPQRLKQCYSDHR